MSTFKLKASRQVLAVAMGVAVSASALAALTSTPTGTVIGRAPVLSDAMIVNQSRPGLAPAVGDTLGVTYVFSDADGDWERHTTHEWFFENQRIAAGPTYVPRWLGEVKARLGTETDCTDTDPCYSEFFVETPAVQIGVRPIGSFLAPDRFARNHAAADAHCQSMGARLPTIEEFQQLLVDAGGGGNQMCDKYGWPQYGDCGGMTHDYWTSVAASDQKYEAFSISSGTTYAYAEDVENNVACVR